MSIFNSYARLEKALMKSGCSGTATVLEARPERMFTHGGAGGQAGMDYPPWFLSLRVVPTTGPEFEVQQKVRVHEFITPTPGETLQVLYDPDDHTRMIVDPRTAPETADEGSALYAAAVHRSMTEGTEGLEQADAASALEIVREKQMEALNQAMGQSPAAAAALQGVVEAQSAAIDQAMERAAHGPPPVPGVADRLEAGLARLQALKDAGTIDDATYQAERQAMLDRL